MIYIIIFVLLSFVIWLSYEFNRAPYMDDNGNIISKTKNTNGKDISPNK